MEQRAAVPKFGNWDAGDNVAYTVYFENARKGRGEVKPYNPNDPEENPNLIPKQSKPPPPAQERKARADHGDIRWSSNPSARNNNSTDGKTGYSSAQDRNLGSSGGPSYGELRRRAGSKGGAGYENGIDRSPPHHQGRVSSRGPAGSPAQDKGSYRSSHGTPGRSRMRPVSRDHGNFDRGAALPKFGDWDAKDPSMANGYTQIFNKVREEKHQRGSGMSPGMHPESPYNGHRKPVKTNEPMGGCCFPWGRK